MAQRFEGRNIDEALTSAAGALGVERYRLLYHVVLEKRGFLGGMKRVVIEAEVNDQASDAPQASVTISAAPPARRGKPRRSSTHTTTTSRSVDRRRCRPPMTTQQDATL